MQCNTKENKCLKYLIVALTLEKPLGISWITQPEGSLLQLINGCELVTLRPMSTETSTTAHTPSPCCLLYLRKLNERAGTSGESNWTSASIWKAFHNQLKPNIAKAKHTVKKHTTCKAPLLLSPMPLDSTSKVAALAIIDENISAHLSCWHKW